MKKPDTELVFIGTGGGRVVISNQSRSSGGFVLSLPNLQFHVDPGPGALSGTAKTNVDPSKTNVIISTHEHIDHSNDINALIEAVTLGGINKKGILISVPSVIEGYRDEIPWVRGAHKKSLKDVVKVSPGDNVKIGDTQVVATKTEHDAEDCVGIRIEGEKISLGYTSDTLYFEDLQKEFEGVSVLIVNVLRPGADNWKTHMCTEDAIKLVERVKPELTIITHFGQKMINANPLLEARDIQKRTGVRTIAAYDALKINLEGIAQGRGVQTTL